LARIYRNIVYHKNNIESLSPTNIDNLKNNYFIYMKWLELIFFVLSPQYL